MAASYTAGSLLVRILPDARGAATKVKREMGAIPPAQVQVEADIREVEKAIGKTRAELEKLQARKNDPKIGLDIRALEAKLGQATARLDELKAKPVTARVTADVAAAEAGIAKLEHQLDGLRKRRDDPQVGLDITEAEAKLAGLSAKRDALGARKAEIKADADTAAAEAKLTWFGRVADVVAGRRVTTHVDVDTGSSLVKLATLSRALSTLGKPVALVGLVGVLGLIGSEAMSAAGALWLMPAALLAGGMAIGALKIATSGIGDTLKYAFDPTKVKQFNEALAKLSPEARTAVMAVKGMGPELMALKSGVQDALFTGLAPMLTTLGGIYLPMVGGGFRGIAGEANYAATEIGTFLMSTTGISAMNTVTGGSVAVFHNLALAAAPIVGALIQIGAIGMPILAQLTAGAGGVAGRFAAWTGSAQGIATITGWIWNAINTLRLMWQVAGNVGSILGSLFGAARSSGEGFLSVLARVTGAIAFALRTPEGAAGFAAFFAGLREVIGGFADRIVLLWPLISAAAGALFALWQAGAPVLDVFYRLAVAVLTPLMQLLGVMAPVLGPVIAAMFVLTAATSAWGAATAWATGMSMGAQAARALLAIATWALTSATWAQAMATWGVNSALLASPITWVILLVVALVAAVIYAWNNFEWFRTVILAVWSAIQVAFTAIGAAAVWLWQTIFVPAWNAISMAVSWAWFSILLPVLTAIWDGLRFLGAIIFVVVVAPFIIAWNIISAIVSWAWTAVILPVWSALVAFAQNVIMPMLVFLYQNVVLPVWSAIGAIISFAWNSIILPVWNALVAFLNVIIIPLLRFLYDNVFLPIWNAIGAVISFVWNSIILPQWNALVAFVNLVLIPLTRFLYEGVIKPVWDAIGAAITFVWQSVIKPAWDAVAAGLMWLADRFREGVDRIGQLWNGIKAMLARPINFMIDVVWNKGVVPAWNKVAGLVGLGPIQPLGLIPEMATGGELGARKDATGGGPVRGAGSWTSDQVPLWGSNGEHMIRASVASKVRPFLSALNSGDGEALQAAGAGAGSVKTFSGTSGLGMNPMVGVPRVPGGYATGGMIDERIRAAKAWLSGPARSAPYVYGGGTNPRRGMDCSSMQSAVTHILSGRPPDSGRIGATSSMPWGGFQRGLNGQYAVGNKPNDHMAGTLAGQNVEQHGPNGNPFVFPSRWGADNGYFPQKYHLGEVGGQFVSGGAGSGGGFFDFISPLIRAAFDALTNPAISALRGLVGAPPPEWRAVPPAFATKARDTVREFMLSKVAGFLGQGTGGPAITDVGGLNGRQRQAAGTIIGVAKSRGMPRKAAEIGVATAMQESQLGTIGYGRAVDHDSLGLFQQRPSQGWGTPAQIQNDVYASNKFFDRLARINFMAMAHTAAAQAVQRSAFPGAYAKWVPLAISAVNAFPGGYDAGGVGVGRGWMWKGTPRDERVLDPRETRDYETLGPLVREMEAARLPVQNMPTLTAAQIAAMGGDGARYPDSFRLTSGRLEFGRDGLVEIVDGRIDAITDELIDGPRP